MDSEQNKPTRLSSVLGTVRKAAEHVHHCPACQSDRIYTAFNTICYFDHQNREFSINSSMNLVENGWHGCRRCNHKWVSNAMLQTALPPKAQTTTKDNVIDLAHHKKETH